MNITATPNEESRKLTAEEKKLVDSLSSLAALLGNALFYYGRSVLNLTFEQYEEIEAAAKEDDLFTLAKDPEKEELEAAAAREKGTQFKEPESPGTQVLQALTLMHPSVRQMLGESALYQIFSDALKHYDRTGESLEEQIHGMNLIPLAGLWIITKRVFAFSHQQDCFRIFDALMKGITEKKLTALPDLEQITDSDRTNMDTFYAAYFAGSPEPVGKEDQPDQQPEEKKQPEEPTSITTFAATDKIYMAASKAFRNQKAIAASGFVIDPADGLEGRKLNVGTASRPVVIRAMITDKDGKSPVQLTEFEMNIEATIGQMFQMNGYKSFKCTPAQIYRIYAGMDTEDTVHPDQIEKVVKAMDKLIQTPATLNFAEQLEKHTRMKKRDNFDYTDASRVGNLITGVHDQRKTHSYNGTTVEHTFTIHEMPMFYAYSYAVGQLYTVSKYLLTGETPPAQEVQKKAKEKPKAAGTRRLRSDDIDLRRYLLRYIEYQKTEKEKRDKKLKAYNKPIPAYFEFFLPFETVAKEFLEGTATAKIMRKIREQTYAFMIEQMNSPDSAVTFADYYKKGKALHGVRVRI